MSRRVLILVALALLAAGVTPAWSAVSFDSTGSAIAASASTASANITFVSTTNSVLIACVAVAGTNLTPTSVKLDATNAFTQVGSTVTDGAFRGLSMWLLKTAAFATGAHTIDATMPGSDTYIIVGGTAYKNVDQTTPNSNTTSTASSGTSSNLVVTSATNNMVANCLLVTGNSPITAGDTSRWTQNDGGTNDSGGMSDAPGAASVGMDWSWSNSNNYETIGTSLNAAAAASSAIKHRAVTEP